MPKILSWRAVGSIQCQAGADGEVSLHRLHDVLATRTLSDEPPFLCAALNPNWVNRRGGVHMQIATACISCQPKCSFRVRLTCPEEPPNFTVEYSGAHDETSLGFKRRELSSSARAYVRPAALYF